VKMSPSLSSQQRKELLEMEEQGGSFASFLPGTALQALLLLLAVTLLLLLDVDDSGSAMTVEETKAVSLECDTDTELDIIDADDNIDKTAAEPVTD